MKENLNSKSQVSLNGLPVSQLPGRRFGELGLGTPQLCWLPQGWCIEGGAALMTCAMGSWRWQHMEGSTHPTLGLETSNPPSYEALQRDPIPLTALGRETGVKEPC